MLFGGKIIQAGEIVHGKTSPIYHKGIGVFKGLINPVEATRYHSLVIDKDTIPECLEITAWTQTLDGEMNEIMGIEHATLPIIGVQFHPESVLTRQGHELLKNFLNY